MTIYSDKGLQKQTTGEMEAGSSTVEISESNAQGSVTITHEGDYNGMPVSLPITYISSKSGGSSSSNVTDVRKDPDNSSETQTTFIVELDTAPGTGETTTVTAEYIILGDYGGQT